MKLRVVGSMSTWDVMNQPGVSLANKEDISEARQRELEAEEIVVLVCIHCDKKYQWLAELLPHV